MSWVYLDDHFPDHPKVVAAGGDAAWLFVCALAYCKRYKTEGAIPAAQVAKLTDRTKPRALAARLVEVRLWETTDTGYQVHDYDQWNRPAETRSEKGRKAAQARWHPPSNTTSNANAPPEHVPHDALIPIPIPIPNSLSSSSHLQTGPESEDEEDLYTKEAKRRLAVSKISVSNPAGWVAAVVKSLRAEGWQPTSTLRPYDVTHPVCATCDSTGWAPYDPLRPILGVRPCPTCHT